MQYARMMDHQVHINPDAARMSLREEIAAIVKRAVFRIYLVIIDDIIFVIAGGRMYGCEPDAFYPQALQVIQPGGNAFQIAYAISVGITERAYEDLVANSRKRIGADFIHSQNRAEAFDTPGA